MELALFVYLAGVVESLKNLFIVICVAVPFGLFASAMHADINNIKNKYIKPLIITFIASGFLAALTPSEKTMYMMAGGYATQQVVTSTVAKKTVSLIEGKLDEELSKLSKQKE